MNVEDEWGFNVGDTDKHEGYTDEEWEEITTDFEGWLKPKP